MRRWVVIALGALACHPTGTTGTIVVRQGIPDAIEVTIVNRCSQSLVARVGGTLQSTVEIPADSSRVASIRSGEALVLEIEDIVMTAVVDGEAPTVEIAKTCRSIGTSSGRTSTQPRGLDRDSR